MSLQKIKKRLDYISWDDYFMGLAFLSAKRSKDPSTQVGACLVNKKNQVVGLGYNGFPRGCSDDVLPWDREGDFLNTKYPYVVHAEENAIVNSTGDLTGGRLYVALFPCNECAKLIIQSGISEVIYVSNKYAHLDPFIASRKMLNMAHVKFRQYKSPLENIVIDFSKV